MIIIDTHTHVYDPTRAQGVPWPPEDNALLYRTVLPEHYRAIAAPHGITGTVVVEASEWIEDNLWVLQLARDEPIIVGFVGHIRPNRPSFAGEIERFARIPLFRGIRVRPDLLADVERGSFLDDMALLAEMDLSMDALARLQHVEAILKLSRAVPDLRIVLNHTLHMPVDGQPVRAEWAEAYRRLGAQPSVYLKVSAVMEQSTIQPAPTDVAFYRPALDAMFAGFGADKVIYGSNWPVCERAGSFADAFQIVKTYFQEKGSDVADNYFWRNSQAVYKWLAR
jgi:L-fuconolactonase